MKRTEPGEGTHTCIPILPDGVEGVIDYSIVPPTSGTYIKIKSIHALHEEWSIRVLLGLILGCLKRSSLSCEPTGTTHRSFVSQPSRIYLRAPIPPPFQHNITYE